MWQIELCVQLKTYDLSALTAKQTLWEMGYKKLTNIFRQDYYLFNISAKTKEEAESIVKSLAEKTPLFVNPNKHTYCIRSQKSEVRIQKSEFRSQNSEFRNKETEDRIEKSGDRSQKSEVRSQNSAFRIPHSEFRSQEEKDCSLLTAHCSLEEKDCSPLTAHRSLIEVLVWYREDVRRKTLLDSLKSFGYSVEDILCGVLWQIEIGDRDIGQEIVERLLVNPHSQDYRIL